MDVHCQNCGERLVATVKPTDTTVEVVCHSCGVTMRMRVTPSVQRETPLGDENEPRPSEQTWKRIFEPIPRGLIYGGGILVALLILSPMLTYLWQNHYQRNPIFLSEDTDGIQASTNANSGLTSPMLTAPDKAPTMLDQYRNLRLDGYREDIVHRYNLRLRNTRGMEPEIYEATRGGEFDRMTANFYNGLLKEVSLITHEQRATPDYIQRDLTEQFGPVTHANEIVGPLSSGTVGGLSGDELTQRINRLSYHRSLIWTDDQYRVEAMIHSSSSSSNVPERSVLSLSLSAATWLRERQMIRRIPTPVPQPSPLSSPSVPMPRTEPAPATAPAPVPAPVQTPVPAPATAPAAPLSFMPVLITNQAAPVAPKR